jgi:hypothetical protein
MTISKSKYINSFSNPRVKRELLRVGIRVKIRVKIRVRRITMLYKSKVSGGL